MAPRSRLSAPKKQTYYIAVALAVVGLILEILALTGTKLAGIDMYLAAFVFVGAGFVLLALANYSKGL